jgi:hypothetical protein
MAVRSEAVAMPLRETRAGGTASPLWLRSLGLTAAVAIALATVAFNGGGYALGVRAPVGIVVWWAVGLGVALGLWPQARLPRSAIATAALPAVLAVLAVASAGWGDSAEAALDEGGRTVLYSGLLALVLVAAGRGSAARWGDGIAAGIAAVGITSLASRLFPGLALTDSASQFFDGQVYLSYPLDYWNGLGAFVALSFPLLLRSALDATGPTTRAVAIAPIPALAGVLYLTSSRGGMLVAAVATIAFVALAAERMRAAVAAAVALAGALGVVAVLSAREQLVDGPFDTAALASQGRAAAALIVIVCVATAVLWGQLSRLAVRGPRSGRAARRATLVVVALAVAAAVVVADPVARFDSFRAPPPDPFAQPLSTADLGTADHLLSAGSSGRWQFWQAAIDEFADSPLIGHGAGSYEAWWAQHGSISYFTRQAHSLYLETLGELGIVGLLLLAGLAGMVGLTAARRRRASAGTDRTTIAALVAVALGFAVAAGIDWLWEMPVVAATGLLACGLLVGPATTPAGVPAGAPRRSLLRVAAPLAAVVAIALLALPWLAERDVRESRRAALSGQPAAGVEAARDAEGLTPWAASPRLQHALVLEASGDLAGARRQIAEAIERDRADWRLRVVQARVASAAGDATAARAALAAARALNPRSRLLAPSETP